MFDRHVNNASTLPPFPLSLEPTAETGSNDMIVVWAPGKFFHMFFAFYLIQLTHIFHLSQVLIYNGEMTPGRRQRPLTGPRKHPQPPPLATARGVGTRATTKRQHRHRTKRNERRRRGADNEKEAKQMNKGPKGRQLTSFGPLVSFFSSHL